MLLLFNSNTDSIRVFVCPPTFWTYDGFSGRCLTTRQVFSLYSGSYEYILFVIWQMLLQFLWQIFSHCFVLLANVIAIFLLNDVIESMFGWWQMLLQPELWFVPLVGMLYIYGSCYCHLGLAILLP